mgnify:CR=1 FL=1|tara:strand:- start:319 stop:573 length:255 start_codon:yes stop_codon:yes gene_type:complete
MMSSLINPISLGAALQGETAEPSNAVVPKQQRLFFTNGQIWENKNSKELRVDRGDQVHVKDGALSAFYLSKVDGTRSVRVKRVK